MEGTAGAVGGIVVDEFLRFWVEFWLKAWQSDHEDEIEISTMGR